MRRQAVRQTTYADELNPYQAPQSTAAQGPQFADMPTKSKKRLYVAWCVVFALNLIVPVSLSWEVTQIAGESGMLVATLILLAVGLLICSNARRLGFALVSGGVATALSQVVPVLQLIAGIAGLGAADALGLMAPPIQNRPTVPIVVNELGGFVVTLTTGALLMAAATGIGFTFRAFFGRSATGDLSK